jgi:hypothetical protein
MKTIYTERDIADMHANGVTEIEIDDDVVLTDLAREKAITLGLKMKLVAQRSGQPAGLPRLAVAPQMQLPPAVTTSATALAPAPPSTLPMVAGQALLPHPPTQLPPSTDLAAQVKAAVIAQLGTSAHNDLLDQIIPQVLAKLGQ